MSRFFAKEDGAGVRVKICGIADPEDAWLAIDLGADALGLNTWRGSPRYLDLEKAESWLRLLPSSISRVALTVNEPLDEAQRLARLPFLDGIQIHGDEDMEYARELALLGRPIVRAIRLRSPAQFDEVPLLTGCWYLVDANVPGAFGGTGVAADLDLAVEFRHRFPEQPLILAGGLKPDSVAAAVERVRPHAVDVSSGVESAPARKDAGLLRAFIEAAHSQD